MHGGKMGFCASPRDTSGAGLDFRRVERTPRLEGAPGPGVSFNRSSLKIAGQGCRSYSNPLLAARAVGKKVAGDIANGGRLQQACCVGTPKGGQFLFRRYAAARRLPDWLQKGALTKTLGARHLKRGLSGPGLPIGQLVATPRQTVPLGDLVCNRLGMAYTKQLTSVRHRGPKGRWLPKIKPPGK